MFNVKAFINLININNDNIIQSQEIADFTRNQDCEISIFTDYFNSLKSDVSVEQFEYCIHNFVQQEYNKGNYEFDLIFNDKKTAKRYEQLKNDLAETKEVYGIHNDKFGDCELTIITNNKLNIRHEILRKQAAYGDYINSKTAIEENLIYYNNKGNLIKVVAAKVNLENGMLNVSETDKNGNTIPIQWQSINPETGATITERHLTSPDGTKTDSFCEEDENFKLTELKITNENGKNLINVKQTFQKLSDNKYISSICATGMDKDTQIYEIEYTDDNKVIIFDKTKNEITEVDLMKYFRNEESAEKLMPIIKQLPGQVLLKLVDKPCSITYESDCLNNGKCDFGGISVLIGNFSNAISENEDLLVTLLHELGHHLDYFNFELFNDLKEQGSGIVFLDDYSEKRHFSNNKKLFNCFEKELKGLRGSTTSEQQKYVGYFINGNGYGAERGRQETIAETYMLLYSSDYYSSFVAIRDLYLSQYFPKTIAEIIRALLEEEGVNVK